MPELSKSAVAKTLIGTAVGLAVFVGLLVVSMSMMGGWVPIAAILSGRQEAKHQQFLLHDVDHQALAATLRDYAGRRRWNLPAPASAAPAEASGGLVLVNGTPAPRDGTSDLSQLPPELQRLKPGYVRINDDQVDLVFGGPLGHYGFSVFRPGLAGEGYRRLGEGIYFFTDDDPQPTASR